MTIVWDKTVEGYCAEASDLKGRAGRCPACAAPLATKKFRVEKDAEGKTIGWSGKCDCCRAELTIFND